MSKEKIRASLHVLAWHPSQLKPMTMAVVIALFSGIPFLACGYLSYRLKKQSVEIADKTQYIEGVCTSYIVTPTTLPDFLGRPKKRHGLFRMGGPKREDLNVRRWVWEPRK